MLSLTLAGSILDVLKSRPRYDFLYNIISSDYSGRSETALKERSQRDTEKY